MTVHKPKDCRTWRYDFWWKGRRYTGTTDQLTRDDAEAFETLYRQRLRRRAGGLEPAGPEDTPRFTDWAKVTFDYAKKRKQLKRPEQLQINIRHVLGFWGAKPTVKTPIDGDAPYHNLRLGHPVADPEWLERFEDWMDARGLSGSRKNAYRSACSLMYRVALLPTHRRRSQVRENPFLNLVRDRVPKRIHTITPAQFRLIVGAAAWHVRIALAVGGLAPKLRLRNVLALRWDQHVAADLSQLVDPDHKTDRETGLPLVVHVSAELRKVLEIAKAHRRGAYVVHYYGKRVHDIKTGLKRAVQAAGLTFGRAGFSYHSLRHTMATELARMALSEPLRARVMGHRDMQTTQIYTHMVPVDEVAPLEALALRMPIADLMMPKLAVGKPAGPRSEAAEKAPRKRESRRQPPRRAKRHFRPETAKRTA